MEEIESDSEEIKEGTVPDDASPSKVLVMDKNLANNNTVVSANQDGPSPLRSQSPFRVADTVQ